MKLNFSFSLRGPDRVSEELATVLSEKGSWEFRSLFDLVHAGLRSKAFARGGEEMLRLRAYEKLQNFLFSGIVTKKGKEYTGVPKALAAFFKTSAEFNARFAAGTHCRPALSYKVAATTPAEDVKVANARPQTRKAQAGTGKKGRNGSPAPARTR
jgi:hypothetical protein